MPHTWKSKVSLTVVTGHLIFSCYFSSTSPMTTCLEEQGFSHCCDSAFDMSIKHLAGILVGETFPNPHKPSKTKIFFGATSIIATEK